MCELVRSVPMQPLYTESDTSGSYKYRVQAFNLTNGRVSGYSNEATVRIQSKVLSILLNTGIISSTSYGEVSELADEHDLGFGF